MKIYYYLLYGFMFFMFFSCSGEKEKKAETYPLWPNGLKINMIRHAEQEATENRTEDQNAKGLNRSISNVSTPEITFHPASHPIDSIAVIIFPGGGYRRIVIDKEGHDIAERLNQAGIHAFVVKYRTLPTDIPRGDDTPLPVKQALMSDGIQAVRLVRENARKWGINPNKIGVMGFSAGGHLAAAVTFLHEQLNFSKKISARPDFSVLMYPAYTAELTSNISASTPPVFLACAGDDETTPVEGTMQLYQKLHKFNIPTNLIVYCKGGHGFGLGVKGGVVTSWPDLFLDWLKKLDL